MQAHHASTTAASTTPSQAGDLVLRISDLTKRYGTRSAGRGRDLYTFLAQAGFVPVEQEKQRTPAIHL